MFHHRISAYPGRSGITGNGGRKVKSLSGPAGAIRHCAYGLSLEGAPPSTASRITQVRPEAAQAYLLRRGWKLLGSAANPLMLMFEAPGEGDNALTVLLPLRIADGFLLQRMIDWVANLSRCEDCWAVDVLSDVLRQPAESILANRSSVPLPIASALQGPLIPVRRPCGMAVRHRIASLSPGPSTELAAIQPEK